MNINTGHLVQVLDTSELASDYIEVPSTLNLAAESVLKGRSEAQVSLTSGGRLSRWAARQRKSRRKIAAKSRQRNRAR